jgi:hypothetical protein
MYSPTAAISFLGWQFGRGVFCWLKLIIITSSQREKYRVTAASVRSLFMNYRLLLIFTLSSLFGCAAIERQPEGVKNFQVFSFSQGKMTKKDREWVIYENGEDLYSKKMESVSLIVKALRACGTATY